MTVPARRRLGIAVIGFGWMGQAHARSYARLPMIFDELGYRPELTVCADTLAERRAAAVDELRLPPRHRGLACRGRPSRG